MSIPDKIRQDAKDRDLRVTVRIGKDGVTENVICEMEKQCFRLLSYEREDLVP